MRTAASHRRKRGGFFDRQPADPAPLTFRLIRRVVFGDADPMGILWHGRYPAYFEAAAAELHRLCGLGYADFFSAEVRAPIARLKVDYLASAFLDEVITVAATLFWNEAARIDTEYLITKADGRIAARGCTVQLFTCAKSSELLLASPAILETCRRRWRSGEFAFLQ
jgi:acyl-CoA thioester hydrolase